MSTRSEMMKMGAGERDGRDSSVDSTKYRDEEWLREKYHGEGLLMQDIADLCGCALSTINHWVNKHDIERKSQSEIQGAKDTRYTDSDWLREKYWEEEMSEPEIADLCGVSQGAIHVWMERHGIETRSKSERQSLVMRDPERRKRQSEVAKEVLGGWEDSDGDVDRSWRDTGKWNLTSYEARHRDNFTCQWCEERPEIVHAHHIKPVSKGGAKFDMDNLITLCPDCHYSAHTDDGEVNF